jgi:hypothetical protein
VLEEISDFGRDFNESLQIRPAPVTLLRTDNKSDIVITGAVLERFQDCLVCPTWTTVVALRQ